MFIDEFLALNDYVDSDPEDEDIDLFNLWSKDHPEYMIYYKTNSKSEIITVNEINRKNIISFGIVHSGSCLPNISTFVMNKIFRQI